MFKHSNSFCFNNKSVNISNNYNLNSNEFDWIAEYLTCCVTMVVQLVFKSVGFVLTI